MTQHRPIGGGGPDWLRDGRTIVHNFPAATFRVSYGPRSATSTFLASFARRDRGRSWPATAMADPGGWAPAQENDFTNFQSNDSFNLNEVTGIDGRSLPRTAPPFDLSSSLPPRVSCPRVFREADVTFFYRPVITSPHY